MQIRDLLFALPSAAVVKDVIGEMIGRGVVAGKLSGGWSESAGRTNAIIVLRGRARERESTGDDVERPRRDFPMHPGRHVRPRS